VQGYDAYQEENRKDVLLVSNDRDLIERVRSHRVLAHRVEFPEELPRSVEVSWDAIQDALYTLAELFGVIRLPKVTLQSVWKGKGGQAWQDEQLLVEYRSHTVEPLLERDLRSIEDEEE
jgi:uncharacterized protein YukE